MKSVDVDLHQKEITDCVFAQGRIYRSLARPALRSFPEHQTGTRFLVGLFDRAGTVEPIVKIDV